MLSLQLHQGNKYDITVMLVSLTVDDVSHKINADKNM